MLLSIAVYYEKKPELVHRFNFQIMLILILIDIFWLLIIGFVWEHDEKDNEYWKELSGLHSLVRYGVIGELLLSCTIVILLFLDYRQVYGKLLNPLDFNYQNKNDEKN